MTRWRWTGLLLVSAATAFGQLGELSISGGKATLRNAELGSFALTGTGGSTTTVTAEAKTDVRIGVRFTVNNQSFFGQEFGYAYNHGKLSISSTPPEEVGMPVHQGFYNFLAYGSPEGSKVRPFAAGGVHFSTFYPPGTGVFSGNGVTKFGINYGGGIKIRVSEIMMLRFDVRDYFQPKPNFWQQDLKGWMHMLETSVGFGLAF
ncbi:MAG: hypothetical protein FJW34_05400 [Acidobacteria bacterium]|nr:hypothetical protein [Acidobacteriota bacterium]